MDNSSSEYPDTRIVCIVQARMGSSRLPGKVMMGINDKPMLWHVLNRVEHSQLLSQIVVATSVRHDDNVIQTFTNELSYKCYRGSETDVLSRYYECAAQYNADIIVRVTGDCPCTDSGVMDNTIRYYMRNHFDYVNDCKFYPDGMDVEVFSFKALEQAHRQSREPQDREHVGQYILRTMRSGDLPKPDNVNIPKVKLSVDTIENLDFVRKVFKSLGNNFGLREVIKYCNGIGIK